jgi:hypothetical protein
MAEAMSRRDFLKALARAALAAGIGALAIRLARGGSRRNGEKCVGEGICRGCSAFGGCGLPAALSARERADWARGRS